MRVASVSQIRSEFDQFLYASVDEGADEPLLSVLSALARVDVDPWKEAADLSRLSRESAIERLTALISALPEVPVGYRNCRTISDRLVTLLPSSTSFKIGSETLAGSGTAANFRAISFLIIINVIFMLFAFAGQYISSVRQAAHVSRAQAQIVRQAVPPAPPPTFGK
jgi:hypothetical protein